MEDLLFLAEELARLLRPSVDEDQLTIREGLALYRQGLVKVTSKEESSVYAIVQDVTPKEVEFDMLFWVASECTCDNSSICKHKIAVFFHLYASIASPADWVIGWTQREKEANSQTKLPIKPASTLLKESAPFEQSYDNWKKFTTNSFTELIEDQFTENSFVMERHIQHYLSTLMSKAPMDSNWKLLYQFITSMITLLHTFKLLDERRNQPYTIRAFYQLTEDLFDSLHSMIYRLANRSRPFAFDSFISNLSEDTIDLLRGNEGLQFEKIDLYRELWTHLFSKKASRKVESERIEQALSTSILSEIERSTHFIAAIHLYILDNQDDRAIPLLKNLTSNDCPYLYDWMKQFADQDTHQRNLPYIEFIIRNLHDYLSEIKDYYACNDHVRILAKPIYASCTQLKRLDLLEKFYREALPYSYWEYSMFLFEQQSYKKWTDLIIYSGVTIDAIGQDMIKTVVASDPKIILPLYHHAVQQTVSLKNRAAYKQAIRYLKKMRTIYKKMKQENVFEDYLDYISLSTKRLRAFQEELQRSKLIDG
ncbi:SWIM zinc finger family protein [Peribacillus huizhouensis]|uniref:SWIM-type domain-containing protein n=1 Tax=Peribacillus huizhouensis TaxID=1501239 RepID=A0ABR6CS41_9BACI|nr:hypothetical protein [Peribacillus huizhouensis]MBA9027841.1 hypothetical protein [Peribacillus huizhouensis]